jgi:dTDP-4-dehydrorhamnose reductase
MSDEVFMLWGCTGWIGGMLAKLSREQGRKIVAATSRLEDSVAMAAELDQHKPTRVLCAAGLTGRPNVDWCESNQEATIRVNVCGTLALADACSARGVHLTVFATGCIYEYDGDHPIGGKGFTEQCTPNYAGSFYSKTKIMVEELLKSYRRVCILRLRMPISNELTERNFVTKIARYHRVVNVPNSMSVLTDLLPLSLAMSAAALEGIYNFTNPGAISHNEVLQIYKEEVDPTFHWENFSIEEQSKVLVAGRSNNFLDTSKLERVAEELGCRLPDIHTATREALIAARSSLEARGLYPSGLPQKLGPGNA